MKLIQATWSFGNKIIINLDNVTSMRQYVTHKGEETSNTLIRFNEHNNEASIVVQESLEYFISKLVAKS